MNMATIHNYQIHMHIATLHSHHTHMHTVTIGNYHIHMHTATTHNYHTHMHMATIHNYHTHRHMATIHNYYTHMHMATIHSHHTCSGLLYTVITHAHGYHTQPSHLHRVTIHSHHICTCYCLHLQTPCTTKVIPIYTQCRYHTHEPDILIPTLYMYHISRHTLTYVCMCVCVCVCHRCLHLHLPSDLPTQAWVYKHTQVHTCCRHVSYSHTHICTIDIYSIDTQYQICSLHHHMNHTLCHMYTSTILI